METEMEMQPFSCCMWGYGLATALVMLPNIIIQRKVRGIKLSELTLQNSNR